MGAQRLHDINVADGDKTPFLGSAPPVANSSYIMLDLKKTSTYRTQSSLSATATSLRGSVDLQVSDDGSTWTKINTFTADDITDNTYSFCPLGQSQIRAHVHRDHHIQHMASS